MSTLVFQVTIKQWDKSQRSPEHEAVRATAPEQFPIDASAQFLVFETPCIIDQHTFASSQSNDQISLTPTQSNSLVPTQTNTQRPLKKAMLADGAIKLERLIIAKQEDGDLAVSYQKDNSDPIFIGHLYTDQSHHWIKVKYQWRYRLENDTGIFWQYEEVTMNIALAENMDKQYFLDNEEAVFKAFE